MARRRIGSQGRHPFWQLYVVFALLFVALSLPVIFATIADTVSFWLSRFALLVPPLLVALIPALVARVYFEQEVPEQTVAVVVNRRKEFLDLLPAGNHWIAPLGQEIKTLHTLVPVSGQFSLKGLRSSDDTLAPLVVLVARQIHPDVVRLLAINQYHKDIVLVMMMTPQQQERQVSEQLEKLIKLHASRHSLSDLQTQLPDRYSPLLETLIKEANDLLVQQGLQVTHLEFLGAISSASPPATPAARAAAPSARAQEALRLLKAAWPKLSAALQTPPAGPTLAQVANESADAAVLITQARQEMNQMLISLAKYYNAVTQALKPFQQQIAPDALRDVTTARREYGDQLTHWQDRVDQVSQKVIEVAQQASHLSILPATLTPEECAALLVILAGIVSGKIDLGPAFP